MAGLKLAGALLRLDALSPAGFTAEQLADAARVNLETARDFLKPDRSVRYTETVGAARERTASGGRPPNLHRLTADGRATLLEHVAFLTGGRAPETAARGTIDNAFETLDLLEASLETLTSGEIDPAEWPERLADARIEFAACNAELRALNETDPHRASGFAFRLGQAQERLSVVARAGPPPAVSDPAIGDVTNQSLAEPAGDPLDWLVTRYGAWIGPAPTTVEPILVLLDGIRGQDPISLMVVESCRDNDLPVAAFNVAQMPFEERAEFYSALGFMRAATPLAACDVVLTVDGRTGLAGELASELQALGAQDAALQRGAESELTIAGLDLAEMRRFYVEQCGSVLAERRSALATGGRRAVFATRCTLALTALSVAEEADAGDIHLNLPSTSTEQNRNRLLSAASELMGQMVCLDASHNSVIEKSFAKAPVDYVSALAG